MSNRAGNAPLEDLLKRLVIRVARRASVPLRNLAPENRFGDKAVCFLDFCAHHGRAPKDRKLFNDIFYRMKTTDEIIDPLRVFISDKEFVKIYVKGIIGDNYNVPTLAVLHSIDEVTQYPFPRACCIKPTHASGLVILREDGEALDLSKIKGWFRTNYYHAEREANYKHLRPKVIVEPIIFGRSNIEDFKFFCFNGKPRLVQVDIDRYTNHTRKFFDREWNEQPFSMQYPRSEKRIDRPSNFDSMLWIAEKLSANFSFIRVDLYSNGKECLVGELTNCHGSAFDCFLPPAAEALASKIVFSK